MKKKVNKIIAVITLSLVLVSCNEEHFDVLPNHQDTPATIFTTQENYRTVLDGAYDYMKEPYSDDTGNLLGVSDILADNVILNPNGRQTNKIAYEWGFSPESGAVTSLYATTYRYISRANLVIDNLDKVASTSYMKNIEAEARAIRAIGHFELVKAYSKIPTQSSDANTTLGIAYVTAFDPAILTTRDETVEESYNKIIADLLFALDNINVNNSEGRLNKVSILGYLSKIYLYNGDYAKAIDYGEQCIALSPSVGTRANFPSIWTDASTDGVLFTVLNGNAATDNRNVGVVYNQNSGGIRSEYTIDYGFYQLFADNDVRKESYILTANSSGTPYNHVVKYRQRPGSNVGTVNVKLLRTADVYLTVAEAYLKVATRDEARALELLNKLRSERYSSYTAGAETGTALLDAILLERRLEFAFENDRFWTIKRLGQSVERSGYGSNIDGTGTDGPTGALKTLSAGNNRFVLPIPLSAIRINPTIKQNQGY